MSSSEKRNNPDYLFDVDFKEYYLILTQQKGFVLIFCCSAMLCSLLLTYFVSEKYVAGTNIYYRPIETSTIRWKETQAFGSPAPSPSFKVIVQTLRSIIKSDDLIRPVVEKLSLDKPVGLPENAAWYKRLFESVKNHAKEWGLKFWSILKFGRIIELEPVDKAATKLRENIEISATKESYVYLITVKDKIPQRAAAIVDQISKDLVEWLRQRAVNSAAMRIAPLEEQLNQKELMLEKMMDEREDILRGKALSEVTHELPEIVKNYGELERTAIVLESEIKGKKRILEAYEKKLKEAGARKIHPSDLKKLESDRIFEEADLAAMIAKRASLERSMADLKVRMDLMRKAMRQIQYIDVKIEAQTREYMHLKDWYLENLSQAQMGESEVELMHPATVPIKPEQPIKIYHVGLTGFLGIFFSSGLIYIFAFFNIRIFFASKGIDGRNG